MGTQRETKGTVVLLTAQIGLPIVFNPHQRCGYSDSPFARNDTFLYCRSRNEFLAVSAVATRFQNQENGSKISKKGFCPKVKSPKMGLLITPRQFL